MPTPILATKLYIPSPRPSLVGRPHLIERLTKGLHGKLTLISAPAGFGKTTLVGAWIAAYDQPVAWLSLDEGDNDPTRFFAYLITALQTISPNVGEGVLASVQSAQSPPTESILTALLNEVATIPHNFVLVLDDYHLLESKPIDDALTFLLDHLPPQMHLVITTREDPQVPLARYRVRSQLTELRAADLRFTPDEAAEFLNHVMGLTLSAEEIAALETCTEGWIAGLQLAALSVQGQADMAGFIQAFAGSHHFVLDYLIEEVLQQQPEHVRSFLLQTSILDRLSGPLCDAVTLQSNGSGQEDGKRMLEALERNNLFVIPLDDKRQWYRYHHLFADVLQTRLLEAQPAQVSMLHQRASVWYDENDLHADAVRHAFAAKDFERAADLVERSWRAMDRNFQQGISLRWLAGLPDELLRARPVLSVGYAWALLAEGELEAAERRLLDAERWLTTTGDGEQNDGNQTDGAPIKMVVVDEAEFQALPATIASAHTYLAQSLGDKAGVVKYAQQTLDLLPEDNHFERMIPAALLGLARWESGDLEGAHRSFAEVMTNMHIAASDMHAIGTGFVMAKIRAAQGRRREALSTYQLALRFATDKGEPAAPGAVDLHVGLGELYCEWGDLETAEEHLQTSKMLGEQAMMSGNDHFWSIAMARLKVAQGDLDGALSMFDEAALLQKRDPIPDVRPIAAQKAQLWARQGRLAEALSWARERNLTIEDDLSYLREFEHLVFARLLIAQHRSTGYGSSEAEESIPNVLGLLDRLLCAAVKGERMGTIIEIHMVQALAHQSCDDTPSALASLERALVLAEPEGYVRIFADEGVPMATLLSAAAADGIMPHYVLKLLAAFEIDTASKIEGDADLSIPRTIHSSHQPRIEPRIEPLSQRELEVLKLIADGLSNREISETLFLALDTVKGHNRRIFGKLQVQRRTEAVARARELAILS